MGVAYSYSRGGVSTAELFCIPLCSPGFDVAHGEIKDSPNWLIYYVLTHRDMVPQVGVHYLQ